jgi:hypothetical protein
MFIKEYHNALSSEFCKTLIEKFENDDRKTPGMTSSGYQPHIKSSTDLLISGKPEYKEEDAVFLTSLQRHLIEYVEGKYLHNNNNLNNINDSGYNIQRTTPGEQFIWHNDYGVNPNNNQIRMVTYLWYLNDVEEGGETEFLSGPKIKPETGKLLLFPATWDQIHKGNPPLNTTKYICTGWVYSDLYFSG